MQLNIKICQVYYKTWNFSSSMLFPLRGISRHNQRNLYIQTGKWYLWLHRILRYDSVHSWFQKEIRNHTSEVPKTITAVMTCSAVTFFPYTQSKKYSSAAKTRLGENGRQTKSSPEKGIFRASSGLLLTFLFHIGTQKCCKIVVIWVHNVIYRCASRQISADWSGAVTDEQDLYHRNPSLS